MDAWPQRDIAREEQNLVTSQPYAVPRRIPATCELNRLPGGYSSVVPPDPIPNSEVKRTRADGSVA